VKYATKASEMITLSTGTLQEISVSTLVYHHSSFCLIQISIDKKRAREQQDEGSTAKRAKTHHTLESGSQALKGNCTKTASPGTASVKPTKQNTASPMPRVQRERTPDSRHIARIVSQLAKAAEQDESSTRKDPKQSTTMKQPSISRFNGDKNNKDDRIGPKAVNARWT